MTDATQEPVAPSGPSSSPPSPGGATPYFYGPDVPYELQTDYMPTLKAPIIPGWCDWCGKPVADMYADYVEDLAPHAHCLAQITRMERDLAAKRAGNDQANWWRLQW